MLNDMKVGSRLMIAFAVVLAMLISVIVVGISRMASVNQGLRTITDEDMIELQHAQAMRSAAFTVSISIRNLMLSADDKAMKSDLEKIHQVEKTFTDEGAALSQMFTRFAGTSDTEKELLS